MPRCKYCTRLFKVCDEDSDMFGSVWCDKIFGAPDVEEERDCMWYKSLTHGDWIRRMTDEEMSKVFGFQIEWLKEEV